jgi:hypothetical protein
LVLQGLPGRAEQRGQLAPEDEIVKKLLDSTQSKTYLRFDNTFGDLIRDAMEAIGGQDLFLRMLIV